MIKNERQYRITKTQAQQFERALAQLTASSPEQKDMQQKDLHPLLLKAQEEGLQSQLTTSVSRLPSTRHWRKGGRKPLSPIPSTSFQPP